MVDGRSTQIGRDAALRRPDGAARRPYLRARMKLAMHSLEPLLIDMGINLGRRNVGVPKHFLNDPQIRPIPEKMSRETVP